MRGKKVLSTVIGCGLGLGILFASGIQTVSDAHQVETHTVTTRWLPDTKTSIKVSSSSSSSQGTTSTATVKNQITIAGKVIPLIDSQGTASAPSGNRAGYWAGNGSTTDSLTTHIIGHNPGAFANVLSLKNGSVIKVTDRNGKSRNYTVYQILTVNASGYGKDGKDYWGIIFGQKGESISLQACIDSKWNMVVLAK